MSGPGKRVFFNRDDERRTPSLSLTQLSSHAPGVSAGVTPGMDVPLSFDKVRGAVAGTGGWACSS